MSLDRECGSKQGFLAKTDAKHVDQLLSCRQRDAFTSWSRPRDQFIMMAAKLGGRDRDHGGPVTDAVTHNRAHGPLIELIERLKTCTPAQRIDLREPILAYGQAAIRSLVDAAVAQPELSASVSSWLEFVVARNPSARGEVVTGLRSIAQGADGELAKAALARLGAAEASKFPREPMGRTGRSAPEAAVHARVRQAARERRLIVYSDLETSRGHVGLYLLHLSQDEAALGHPPITSIVVSKTTQRPGDGYLPAMIEVGFARPGESLGEVWERAITQVFDFWASQPDETSAISD
ncbi:MAG: hypothetical protein HYX57_05090 [Chloroflexi bacterium]|nr:hypothetical protein [Chloroflexota bacterium]